MLPKRLAMFAWCALISLSVATATAAEPTFFPNLSTVWLPRNSSQLLKPYLPAGGGTSDNYRFVVETPKYLKFVVVEPGFGNPPDDIRVEPGKTRDGVAYVRHVLKYHKAEKLGAGGTAHIASLLFHADQDAPEGRGRVFTYMLSSDGKPRGIRPTELVILPPLKNVRPKRVRIVPCYYTPMFVPKVAEAYAENAWQSGVTWIYGKKNNDVASILQSRGLRVYFDKPGEPFQAYGKSAGDFLKGRPDLHAVGYDGKPQGSFFCPTWLLSADGDKMRRILEDQLVATLDADGCSALSWDIEQPVCSENEGFCVCPRCLTAFRKQQRLSADVKLDAQSIVAKHKDAWVLFRCRQNAELVGHVRAALKRCARPIAFSVYSGYHNLTTLEHYGVDWAMLAPHLDLAIAGYGGSRDVIQETRKALGGVPFVSGLMYYLSPDPISAPAAWMRYDLAKVPNPLAWRNGLLQQFVDGGCQGVLIWWLPTMDGGAFYYTSEAAEIIAAYEDLFYSDHRCDAKIRVTGLNPVDWAAFEKDGRRLLLLMNPTAKAAATHVVQAAIPDQWKVRLHGEQKPAQLDPKAFDLAIEPWGTRVVVFSKQ
jgi:hypothetical protein